MKLGILTLPLHSNYGYLLQNFALQCTLKKLGHQPFTINLKRYATNRLHRFLSNVKRCILRNITGNKSLATRYYMSESDRIILDRHTDDFIRGNLSVTESLDNNSLAKLEKYGFEGFIVGSDQVWRPEYVVNVPVYFLNFVAADQNIKKLSYAASFGVDDWRFSESLTSECSRLLQMFDGVSVRESSGVELCKKHFNVDAVRVLDPTLLLDKSEYLQLVDVGMSLRSNPGGLMVYLLDKTRGTHAIQTALSDYLGLQPFITGPSAKFIDVGRRRINDCVFPPVSQWLADFNNASFVLTDSFHGIVFSLVFNKPFIAIGNRDRGLARFVSLLTMFGLENRLIFSEKDDFRKLADEKIDFAEINHYIREESKLSLDFLTNSLL